MPTLDSTSEQVDRLKRAALGMGITLAPVAALACAQFLLAPRTVAVVGGMDPQVDVWAVSAVRCSLVQGYTVIATTISAYWLLTGTFSRGQFLKVRSANGVLALSGLALGFAMAIASTVPMPARLFKVVCPVLGLPDTIPALPTGTFGFDGQSSCEAFAQGAVPTVLLGLPMILLTTSAILRIVLSRRG